MHTLYDQVMMEICRLDAERQQPIEGIILIAHRDVIFQIEKDRLYLRRHWNDMNWTADGFSMQVVRAVHFPEDEFIICSPSRGVFKYKFKNNGEEKNTLP